MRTLLRLIRVGIHLCWAIILLIVTAITGQKELRNKLAQKWCAAALPMLGIEVVLEGELEQGCLQVANHITWIDVAVMMSQGCRGFVSKSEVASWPLVGRLVSSVDTVFIERGAWKTDAARNEMTKRLNNGQGVLFFPEGTTSDGRRVQRFHARLFEAALSSGAKVQPLALRYEVIDGDYDALPYTDVQFVENILAVIRQPRTVVHLTACEPFAVDGFDRKGLARESRSRIITALNMDSSESVAINAVAEVV